MKSSIGVINVRSVPSTFSWDLCSYAVNPSNIIPVNQTINGTTYSVYTGYAPVMQVLLDSSPYDFNTSNPYQVRSINFGDYYNSSSNILNLSGIADAKFSHTYVMPGLYQIKLSMAEYAIIDAVTWDAITNLDNPNLIWPAYTGLSASTSTSSSTIVPQVTANITETTSNFLLSVVEIMPTGYLSSSVSFKPEEIIFPLTVTITPKYTQTGSFPIERIVWDLGDGSPLLTRTRWDTSITTPFVSSGAFDLDPKDPRNYDIVHTYYKSNTQQYSFYPSITAYTCSTNSSDVCAITIGSTISPIIDSTTNKFTLLHAELNQDGTAILAQLGKDVSVWKTN